MSLSKTKQLWQKWRGFILFLTLMLFFRCSVADWNTVPTGSMKPTIQEGDRILVNKLAYDAKLPLIDTPLININAPKRGDVIVFNSPTTGIRLVKRLIGLPGDVIAMQNNVLYINGKKLNYSASNEHSQNNTNDLIVSELLESKTHSVKWQSTKINHANSFPPTTVPKGHYFFMGDDSADSRFFGFVRHKLLIGRAEKVVMSLNPDNFYLPRKERFFIDL